MPTILITGANRGFGLGLVKHYAADGWRVLACCRDTTAASLQKAVAGSGGRVTVHRFDAEDHASIDALAKSLKGQPIDILLNVAGYYGAKVMTEPGGAQAFGESDFAQWEKIYRINVIAPMKVCEAFVENVAASTRKVMINITSIVGSIGVIGNGMGGGLYGYRASKAALNAITRAMAEDLRPRGITVLPLHPGWARTDMGGPMAELEPQVAIDAMKLVIDRVSFADTGKFLTYEGGTLPW